MKKVTLVVAVFLLVAGCAGQPNRPSAAAAESAPQKKDAQPVTEPTKEPPQQPVPQQSTTEPYCDFDLPDHAPEGAQPIDPGAVTSTVIAEAIKSANRPDWGQLHITMTNAWQVSQELKAAAGYSDAGSGALVLLPVSGEPKLLMLGVMGAPGPARIHSVKGDFVIVSQGYGYVALNYRTGELSRCGRRVRR